MSSIKWRQKDITKLSTYVRKFNAAITRLEKQSPELIGSGVLPERLNVAELRGNIKTRADFNYYTNKIDRFFKKGARDIVLDKSGFRTTKWAIKEQTILQNRINAIRRRTIKEFGVRKGQRSFLGLEPIDIQKEKERILKKASKQETQEDYENVMQEWFNLAYSLERESSSSYYAENFAKLRSAYMNAITEHMPPELANQLIKFIKDNDIWGSDIVYAISLNDYLDFETYYNLEDEYVRSQNMLELWEEILPQIKESPHYKAHKKK